MKILIIGGTSGIGHEVLLQALNRGYTVTLLARNPAKVEKDKKNLHVIQGDILDDRSVNTAMKHKDGVVSAIGIPPTLKPVTVFSRGIANVLEAMKEQGCYRLICVSGIGAGETRGHGGFLYDKIVQPLLLKTNYQDKERMEELVMKSDVDWTIVRPGFLTNGRLTGTYKIITDMTGVKSGKISRADVAHFILNELETNQYVNQTPFLSK